MQLRIPLGRYYSFTLFTVAWQKGKQSRVSVTLQIIGSLQLQADGVGLERFVHIHNGQRGNSDVLYMSS